MSKDVHDLLINLLGGILVAVLDRLIIYLNKVIKSYRFKQIFGNDAAKFNIVYGKMVLKPEYALRDKFPYQKLNTDKNFSISNPVSFAETRAAKYLSESFSKFADASPHFISDDEIREKVDISYCALGGYTNHKTVDIIESSQNVFLKFNLKAQGSIVNLKNEQKIYIIDGVYDYAVIIKIRNRLFPTRTQICIAGLGEWGTSGGSWFLAYKWKEIRKKVGNKEFGAVIKVKGGSDESAELIDLILK